MLCDFALYEHFMERVQGVGCPCHAVMRFFGGDWLIDFVRSILNQVKLLIYRDI